MKTAEPDSERTRLRAPGVAHQTLPKREIMSNLEYSSSNGNVIISYSLMFKTLTRHRRDNLNGFTQVPPSYPIIVQTSRGAAGAYLSRELPIVCHSDIQGAILVALTSRSGQ